MIGFAWVLVHPPFLHDVRLVAATFLFLAPLYLSAMINQGTERGDRYRNGATGIKRKERVGAVEGQNGGTKTARPDQTSSKKFRRTLGRNNQHNDSQARQDHKTFRRKELLSGRAADINYSCPDCPSFCPSRPFVQKAYSLQQQPARTASNAPIPYRLLQGV